MPRFALLTAIAVLSAAAEDMPCEMTEWGAWGPCDRSCGVLKDGQEVQEALLDSILTGRGKDPEKFCILHTRCDIDVTAEEEEAFYGRSREYAQ